MHILFLYSGFGAAVIQLCVKSICFEQGFVGALLDDVAAFHNQNQVRVDILFLNQKSSFFSPKQ